MCRYCKNKDMESRHGWGEYVAPKGSVVVHHKKYTHDSYSDLFCYDPVQVNFIHISQGYITGCVTIARDDIGGAVLRNMRK